MDKAWTRPLTPEGKVDEDDPRFEDMVGCHRGAFMAYNVDSPQPGCEYVWERNKVHDLVRVRQQGGHIVQGDDPEMSILSKMIGDSDDGLSGTPLDSTDTTNELVLVRYPAAVVARKRQEERDRSERMRRGGAQEFAERASQMERQYAGSGPSRFRRSDHAIDHKDDAERLVDQWTPDDGIIPRERG